MEVVLEEEEGRSTRRHRGSSGSFGAAVLFTRTQGEKKRDFDDGETQTGSTPWRWWGYGGGDIRTLTPVAGVEGWIYFGGGAQPSPPRSSSSL
jgi:hypothetical protein